MGKAHSDAEFDFRPAHTYIRLRSASRGLGLWLLVFLRLRVRPSRLSS